MRTIAIVPVKRYARAKQRLGQTGLSSWWRRALTEAMLTDVLVALRRCAAVDATCVVTAEPLASLLAATHGAAVLDDPHEQGQSAAAQLGIERVLRQGAERALLVPGDCPALDPLELDLLLREDDGRRTSVTIVPDRHGSGTNALVLTPPDAMEPCFGGDSRARHEARAAGLGVSARVREVTSLALDVDTAADLAALDEALAHRRGGAAHTRGMIAQLGRVALVGAA
jgi:2-phospho-L-lactate/phosphoenolpyruvate guanylyltransferase